MRSLNSPRFGLVTRRALPFTAMLTAVLATPALASSRSDCTPNRCVSPNHAFYSVLTQGSDQSGVDYYRLVIHAANGRVVGSQQGGSNVHIVDEKWTEDNRYLLVGVGDSRYMGDFVAVALEIGEDGHISRTIKLDDLASGQVFEMSLVPHRPNLVRLRWQMMSNEGWVTIDIPSHTVASTAPVVTDQAAFRDGHADRQAWEAWFAGQAGAFRQGAEFWAAHRSDRRPPACAATDDVAFRAGCEEAQRRLAAIDRRRAEPDYRAGWNSALEAAAPSPPGAPPPNRQLVVAAIRTPDGHFLTAVNGGGLNSDATNWLPLGSYATAPGPWEKFALLWTNPTRCEFALQTQQGTFVTAVRGGSIGGPNTAASPFHTDAPVANGWEQFRLIFDPDGQHVLVQTPDGQHYVTALGGGGIGGPDAPIHTDARQVNAWERFTLLPSTQFQCGQPGAGLLYQPPPVIQTPVTQAPAGPLMQSGLWNITQTVNGQATISGSRCITPEMVAQITEGNGQLLLNNPPSNSCQLQQQVVGNQIVAGGQCNTGGAMIEMSARITFETPQHLTGQASWSGSTRMQQLNMSTTFEGWRAGGC